ncbi:MAG TPA: 3-oxoacyl-ACP synthase, partial [bacterium]|nr:3-oxoacyl-ACP synthase [bacterium]
PNAPRKKVVNFALSNSLGFGGHNSTIAFKKYKG